MNKTIKITLELTDEAVMAIEQTAQESIKTLLEKEINENTETFIEMMGYDNW